MKKGVGGRAQTYSVILVALVVSIFVIYLSSVIAVHTVRSSAGNTVVSVYEGVNTVFNISVNNSDANQTANITMVTITLPTSFNYSANSANSSILNYTNFTFANTTSILNWSNQTHFIINGSASSEGTFVYFWFNASPSFPGRYTFVLRTWNATGEFNQGNITINVNDTRNSTGFHLFPSNNTFTTSSTYNFSANVTDNFNLSNVMLYVWNSTTIIVPNATASILNTSVTNGTNVLVNFTFTFPREARYFWNFLVNDSANNSAFNITNFTIVYDISPPSTTLLNDSGADVNYSFVSRNYTLINATATDVVAGISNVTVYLWYGNGTLLNETNTSVSTLVNITNLSDGKYYYNATATDYANNRNTTATKTVTIDLTTPTTAILNDSGADANNTFLSRTFVLLNATATDAINISNITIFLSNASGVVNQSNGTTGVLVNLSGLGDNVYHYNVTATDYANNRNISTITRRVTIDSTTPSQIVFNSSTDSNNTYVARNFTVINISGADNLNITNITIFLWFGNGTLLNESFSTTANATGLYYVNITNLSDGKYYYNATATDYANNRNTTGARTIYIDLTVPYNISFVTTSDANNTYVSRNNTFINVSVHDAINISNITYFFGYANGTPLNETTTIVGVANRTNLVLNITNLSDGQYYYNVSVTDQANNRNYSGTRTIYIDLTRPLVEFNTTVPGNTSANYANVSRTWIFVNATASDTNEANITFTLYNSTGGATNVTTFANTSVRTINWTGLANGNYTYNVTVTDYANNRNTTATRTIFIDTVGPSVSVAKTSSTKTTLTLTITATDAVSGVNTPCTVNRGGAIVSGSTITESGLACSTSYAYDVTCNDFAGIATVGPLSATTDSCSGGESASGGGGSSTTTTTSTWASTFVPEKALFETGYTRTLAPKERIRVDIGNTAHHAGVLEVTATTVKIQIASTPQEATLSIGESKKFEVTNDSIYDLKVTLVAIKDGKADITVQSIAEPFGSSTPAQQVTTPTDAKAETAKTTESGAADNLKLDDGDAQSKSSKWIVWVVIIVAIIIVLAIVRRRKR